MKTFFLICVVLAMAEHLLPGSVSDSSGTKPGLRLSIAAGAGNFNKTSAKKNDKFLRSLPAEFDYDFGAEFSYGWLRAGINGGVYNKDIFERYSAEFIEMYGFGARFNYYKSYVGAYAGLSARYAALTAGYLTYGGNNKMGILHLRIGAKDMYYATFDINGSAPMASGGGIVTLGTGFIIDDEYELALWAGIGFIDFENVAAYIKPSMMLAWNLHVALTAGLPFAGGSKFLSLQLSREFSL